MHMTHAFVLVGKRTFFWFFICIYSTTTITFDVLIGTLYTIYGDFNLIQTNMSLM